MSNHPPGAISTVQELQHYDVVHIVVVRKARGANIGKIESSAINPSVWNIGFYARGYPDDFVFVNYWDAWAYYVRMNAKKEAK